MSYAPLLEIVVTARPSWARVKSIAENYIELHGKRRLRISLVGPSVSSRYGNLTSQISADFELRSFPALHDSDSLDAVALSCIEGANGLVRTWANDRPDCVLVIADRTETLGVSLAASLMQIPIIHLQGGEISGSIDDKIRDTNSKLADLHLTTNQYSKEQLLLMNEPEERIHVIGCPSIDLVRSEIDKTQNWNVLLDDLGGVGGNFSLGEKYGIVMFHPDTLHEEENMIWIERLIQLVERSNINWFWFWPNPDFGTSDVSRRLRQAREQGQLTKVRFLINLLPHDFIQLALRSQIMVGNSSFGIREASFIGLPVLNIGKRQIGRAKSNNVTDIPILIEVEAFMRQFLARMGSRVPGSNLYGDGSAGLTAARIIGQWTPSIKMRHVGV